MICNYFLQSLTTVFLTRAKMRGTVTQPRLVTIAHASRDLEDQTVTVSANSSVISKFFASSERLHKQTYFFCIVVFLFVYLIEVKSLNDSNI